MSQPTWLNSYTFYLVLHGSQAYGMSTEHSDVDFKGIFMMPFDKRHSLFEHIDMQENAAWIAEEYKDRINPNNPKIESACYNLGKYMKLAADANPTILEMLWVEPGYVVRNSFAGEMLRRYRGLFSSTKVRWTFAGYANAQIAKIERHRKWLRMEETPVKPTRAQFGLLDEPNPAGVAADRYIRQQLEHWNFSNVGISSEDAMEAKELCWDLASHLCAASQVDWGNWPDQHYQAALFKLQRQALLPSEILALIQAEKNYQRASQDWKGYQQWLTGRHEGRKELEIKYGYDTKHAAHVVRLLRSGMEFLKTGELQVLRPDADELLSIRNGAWSYDRLRDYAKAETAALEQFDDNDSPLPKKPNRASIDQLYYELMS